ncbi:BQ5605_C029g10673 [Microbotryum silenes-dioicae]|uniref:BQ5605_C029g10673 protein n=1 Tax=Microbotryum silenes-dioicae TaxID=796604 RepID=A0A2X0MJ83_9BASI|nr:BQ5605_C029g10673 [Microbotryum silenes-dioicae]
MHLLCLPPEILLEIVGQFDSVLTLLAFANLCRSTYSFMHEASEQIYRQLCFKIGYTDVTSYGASSAIDTQWRGRWRMSHRDPGLELREALGRQNSRRKPIYLDCVRRWERFAKMRFFLDRSWRLGELILTSTKIENGGPPGGIHRFKVDPDSGIYLTTGVNCRSLLLLMGDIVFPALIAAIFNALMQPASAPFATTGSPNGSAVNPLRCTLTSNSGTFTPRFNQGYIGCMAGEQHIIWRRSDISTPKAPISQARAKFLESRSIKIGGPSGREFRPFAEIAAPGSLNATKMRDPYFIGSSNQRRALYRFDYHRGTMSTLDLSRLWQTTGENALADSTITYVEILDRDHVVVAGRKSISIWHPDRGCVALFPPAAPASRVTIPRAHYRSNAKAPTWTAVHHDLRHGHLIATSMGERGVTGSGKLIWIPNWKMLINGSPSEVEDATVVLTTNAAIIQLSVENERALFVTQDFSTNICALWLLHLRPFTSIEDFKENPPVLMCLLFPLPCTQPPARIEMTIDEIMFPCCSEFMPPPGREAREDDLSSWYQRVLNLARGLKPVDMRWETLSAETLWKDPGKPNPASGSPSNDRDALREVEKQWASVLSEADGTMDSMCSLSFGTDFWALC